MSWYECLWETCEERSSFKFYGTTGSWFSSTTLVSVLFGVRKWLIEAFKTTFLDEWSAIFVLSSIKKTTSSSGLLSGSPVLSCSSSLSSKCTSLPSSYSSEEKSSLIQLPSSSSSGRKRTLTVFFPLHKVAMSLSKSNKVLMVFISGLPIISRNEALFRMTNGMACVIFPVVMKTLLTSRRTCAWKCRPS